MASVIAKPAISGPRPCIGGFFEAHEPGAITGEPTVLDAWTGGRPFAAFVSARSAFAALAASIPAATIWLPAYICAELASASDADRTRFYPVDDRFEPELAALEAEAKPGDLVLLVAYFGLPICERAQAFVRRRPDLRFVEDRAQALDAGAGLGRTWRLFSPRKLLGVADGGLLVAPEASGPLPAPMGLADSDALWAAPLLRGADPAGARNAQWHAANQAKEAGMSVTSEAMTPRSLSILASTSLASLAAPRLRNWAALDRRLRAWSALPAAPPAPPLGYVLRLEPTVRDRLLQTLHAERVFAAVHWPKVAAPANRFPREAAWTRELITLPCDHRYGVAEMERIADCVTGVLG